LRNDQDFKIGTAARFIPAGTAPSRRWPTAKSKLGRPARSTITRHRP